MSDPDPTGLPQEATGTTPGRHPGPVRSALIIAHDLLFAENLKTFFELLGLEARATASAEGALQLIGTWMPGIVLLDDRLPGTDAMQLLGRLRQQHPPLPVVAVTGHGNTLAAAEALSRGAVGALTRPLELDRLHAIIDDLSRAWSAAPAEASMPAEPPTSGLLADLDRGMRRLLGL